MRDFLQPHIGNQVAVQVNGTDLKHSFFMGTLKSVRKTGSGNVLTILQEDKKVYLRADKVISIQPRGGNGCSDLGESEEENSAAEDDDGPVKTFSRYKDTRAKTEVIKAIKTAFRECDQDNFTAKELLEEVNAQYPENGYSKGTLRQYVYKTCHYLVEEDILDKNGWDYTLNNGHSRSAAEDYDFDEARRRENSAMQELIGEDRA